MSTTTTLKATEKGARALRGKLFGSVVPKIVALSFGAFLLASDAGAIQSQVAPFPGDFVRPAPIHAKLDGLDVPFPDAQPTIVKGHLMVPIRGFFERMNAIMQWHEDSQTVTAQRGPHKISMQINSGMATIDGKVVVVDSPPMIIDGRTMVPLRFLSKALGAALKWNGDTRTAEITTLGGDLPPAPTGAVGGLRL